MNPPAFLARTSPLVYPAALLSAASLVWTSWSLIDLLGAEEVGITVAAGADIIWASIIVAEYRGLRIMGRRWPVHVLGWLTLLAVAAFLAWHGIEQDVIAMAVAGPFLPLGAKIVWALALADMRDPAALTDDEQHQLAEMRRHMAFEEAQHSITMRRRQMQAELQMTEVDTDFDIEFKRQNKQRELHRQRPLALDAAPAARPLPVSGGAPHDAPADAAAHQGEADEAPHDAPHPQHEEQPAQQGRPPLVPVPPHGTQPPPALDLTELPKSKAVLLMKEKHPGDSAPQIVRRLAEHGVEVTDGYVRTALGRAARKAQQNDQPDGQGLYL
ncbi:hypothetical protein RM572_21865 [Streptomyces sp. DSM 42041]|uniref:DUF2637 domain-containing protein n=1 Tax=Streptomyces hazeniae TaxID=3075538 RepID=A0ABU2NXF1_9ACTN|nr:hypothetical protein [Streptomyces sp. DSM 42041]MDT0381409.1 hypothetical protein [Streptomyces sp. DSM 42041]